MIEMRKEYDFKDRHKNSSLSESSLFTEHNLDTTINRSNEESKSEILAPFNTNEGDNKFMESVEPLIVSRKVIKFSSKLREINRKYERDNNSNNDNGIYVNNASSDIPIKSHSTRLTATNSTQSSSSHPDNQILNKMETMGFEKSFVLDSLKSNVHNCATTCYYLLHED